MVRKKSKKGSLGDLAYIGVVMIVIAVTVLISYTLLSNIISKFDENSNIPDGSIDLMNQVNAQYTGTIDNTFLFLLIGLSIITIFLAGMVRIHPVFIVFYMFMLAVIIFLSAAFTNIYLEMANNTNFSTYAEDLIIITHVCQYLPFIVGAIGSILAIIMYKNWTENAQ